MKIITANIDSPQVMQRLWTLLDRPSSRPSVIYYWRTVSGTWSSPASWPECPTDWPTPSRPKVRPWLGRKRCRVCWREWPEKCSRLPSRGKPAWLRGSQPHPWSTTPPTWGRGSCQSVKASVVIRVRENMNSDVVNMFSSWRKLPNGSSQTCLLKLMTLCVFYLWILLKIISVANFIIITFK